MAANNTLQHPTHDHPLVIRDFSKYSIGPRCHLCKRNISAFGYTGQVGRVFYDYHRVCVEAPPRIDLHPLHPHHPLTLIHGRSFICDACGEHFTLRGSSFRCEECDFDLDLSCALATLSDQGGSQGKTPEEIDLPLHPHTLTSFSTRHDFVGVSNCVICKASVEGDGYMCFHRSCEFLIHKGCIQDVYYADGTKAPRIYHHHPLETFLGAEMGWSGHASCGSDASSWEFIGCARCRVFINRDCIQVPEILHYPPHPDHTLFLSIKPPDKQGLRCGSFSLYLNGELCYGCPSCEFFVDVGCALQTIAYCDEGMSAKIKLWWHEHSLFLCHKTKSGSNYCSYCGDEPTGPTYVCNTKKCGFLLHERCIKIDRKMICPHHLDHPLTLQGTSTGPPPLCEACHKTIHGLIFSCELCAFHLHSQCAARVPTRKHYLHEHELLRFDEVPFLECNRCGTSTDSPLFRCVHCNFNLHEKCMELPRVVKHETHVHPLTLQETYVEDDSGEYYCDLCEKRRDGRLGVYVCGQCTARWAFHIECILPELRKVFARKGQSFDVEALDEKIMSIEEEVRATEEKLKGLKGEFDGLMKKRKQIFSREEKNSVAVTGEGEP